MDVPGRILIVEDLHVDVELIHYEARRVLPDCAFEQVAARDTFLEALERLRPDLIIWNYRLASFDGPTVLQLAAQHAPFTSLIILTSSIDEAAAVECMKAGAIDYVLREQIERLGPAISHLNAPQYTRTLPSQLSTTSAQQLSIWRRLTPAIE
jgi:CheY-like chemotaxis protein